MATTTNYSWETPDDTDLVKDGAAAIRTLGSSVDTTTKALNPSTTLGDIEYRSSTANTNTRLGIGSTGQILTVSDGVPAWTTAGGGGKLLQLVNGTYATSTANTTTTYADTGLTATITPTLSTSKILILVSIEWVKNANDANSAVDFKLFRGATDLSTWSTIGYTETAIYNAGMFAINYLDDPETTSATTYKIQFRNRVAASSVSVQYGNALSSMTLMEIGA
jgi:hypothetical protein